VTAEPTGSDRPDTPAQRRRRRAVVMLFFTNGASFSSWLPRIPEVRERLDLSLGSLGAVLIAVGLGGLITSVVAGAVVDRIGSRATAVGAAVVLSLGLPLIGLAPSALLLAGALLALSSVDALADVAMNVQAAEVQRLSGRSVVQRFHAAWSIGTVAGAGSGTAAAALGIGLTVQLVGTGLLLAGMALAASRRLPRVGDVVDEAEEGPERRISAVVLLALTALALAMIEGTPGDWAAVFGVDVHGATEGVAGLGFVAVASGMVVGRLGGDRATDRLGERRLFRVALAVVAAGLAVVVLSPVVAVAILGFAVIGCGISVLFPALYLQAATTPGVPAGFGVGVMSSGARLGFLLSPPTTGALSEATSLRTGLGVVVGAAIGASALLSWAAGRMGHGRPAGR
jgi:MFS family permease